jgi:hypothetical protein
MKPQWQVKLTVPGKEKPYTQNDMDLVIGHPINLTITVLIGNSSSPLPMVGTITDAEIQPNGSAVLTMDVRTA